jgi:hypothetical protein
MMDQARGALEFHYIYEWALAREAFENKRGTE